MLDKTTLELSARDATASRKLIADRIGKDVRSLIQIQLLQVGLNGVGRANSSDKLRHYACTTLTLKPRQMCGQTHRQNRPTLQTLVVGRSLRLSLKALSA